MSDPGINSSSGPKVPADTMLPAEGGYERLQEVMNKNSENYPVGFEDLDDDQRDAIVETLNSNSQVKAIAAGPGRGKTCVQQMIKDVYEDHDDSVEVIGLAQGAAAAKNLSEETGLDTLTVDDFLEEQWDPSSSNSPDVVLLDEASLVPALKNDMLMDEAAKQGFELIMVGDHLQLGPEQGTGVFHEAVNGLGQIEGIEPPELTVNYRQSDPLKSQVELARHETGEAIKKLSTNENNGGEVIEATEESNRLAEIYDTFKVDDMVVTSTENQKHALNKICRQKLKDTGHLSEQQEKSFEVFRADNRLGEIKLSPGDQVQINETFRTDDSIIYQGETAEVKAVNEDSLQLKTLGDASEEFTIDSDDTPSIDYFYAMTARESQGQSADRVICYMPAEQGQNMREDVYVGMSRAKEEVKFVTDDTENFAKKADRSQLPALNTSDPRPDEEFEKKLSKNPLSWGRPEASDFELSDQFEEFGSSKENRAQDIFSRTPGGRNSDYRESVAEERVQSEEVNEGPTTDESPEIEL